jgi:CheY-like chemotaxis protein
MPEKMILVVDDEKEMAAYLRRALEGDGYRVMTAVNGREGIECILKEKPDLVLMDVLMPVVQGAEALHYLKQRTDLRKTKFILMSSLPPKAFDSMSPDRSTADGYLHKPVSMKDLLAQVSKILADDHEDLEEPA